MNWVHPISIVLAAWLCVFGQSRFDGLREWIGAQPNVLPTLVVYAALGANLTTTAAVAIIGGLGLDALSPGPFGLGMVPLVILGLAVHRRRDLVLRRSWLAQSVLGGVASTVVAVTSLVLLFLVGPLHPGGAPVQAYWPEARELGMVAPPAGWRMAWQVACTGLAGLVLTPLVFRFFDWVERAFSFRVAEDVGYRGNREIKRGRS